MGLLACGSLRSFPRVLGRFLLFLRLLGLTGFVALGKTFLVAFVEALLVGLGLGHGLVASGTRGLEVLLVSSSGPHWSHVEVVAEVELLLFL